MKFEIGMKITCQIGVYNITDAKLQYENYSETTEGSDCRWFICQNKRDGAFCKNRLGYKFSYVLPVGCDSSEDLHSSSIIRNIKLVSNKLDKIKSILEQIK